MLENFREFQAGPDPFGRMWQVHLNWLQTGISIRHADTVDVKFGISTDGQSFEERVIALPNPLCWFSARTPAIRSPMPGA